MGYARPLSACASVPARRISSIARAGVLCGEHTRSCDEHIGAFSAYQPCRTLCADAPIDLDEQIGVALLGYLRNIRHALFASFDVRLPRKARKYAHDQDHIDLFDERIERLDGHIGLERERWMGSPLANMAQERMKLVFVGTASIWTET